MYCITAITNSKSIAFGNYLIETLKTYNLVKFRKANYPFKAKKTTKKTKLTRGQLFAHLLTIEDDLYALPDIYDLYLYELLVFHGRASICNTGSL